MPSSAIHVVRPAHARYEGLIVGLASLTVIAILVAYVLRFGQDSEGDPLYDWQVSAYDVLQGADQAIYNALYAARYDIPGIFDDLTRSLEPGETPRWPSPELLDEYEVPPFHRDRSWIQNGSLQWTLHEPLAQGEMQGSTMYLGTDGTRADQGSFLLVIGHVHAGFQNNNASVVWWKKTSHAEMPESGFADGLILQGWREVVPHSGANEVKRLFGGEDEIPGADPLDPADHPDDAEVAEKALETLEHD